MIIHPNNLIEKHLSDVKFIGIDMKKQHPQTNIAFRDTKTTISAQCNLRHVLMEKC